MAWTYTEDWTADDYDLRNIVGMDNSANWLLGVNREEFLAGNDDTLVPFVIVSDEEDFATMVSETIQFVRESGSVIVEIQAGPDGPVIGGNGFFPFLANLAFFITISTAERLASFRASAKSIVLSNPSPVLQGMTKLLILPIPEFDPPPGGWPSDTVITGIVDDGIAFAHERFRDAPSSTRVYGVWDQSQFFNPLFPDYGKAFNRKEDIDAELGKNEDLIYRDTGLVDHRDLKHKASAWRRAHGTHVADVAAGFAMSSARTDRPILAVNLPTRIVADTLARKLDWFLVVGGYFVLLWARQIFETGAPERPIIINASFGHHSGPHDGTSLFDNLLSRLKMERPDEDFHLVVPAGNSHLSRCYAQVDLSAGDVEFDWMVQPNDMTASFFEVWLPRNGPGNQIALTITTPDGVPHTIEDALFSFAVLRDQSGQKVGEAEATIQFDRFCLRVSIQPTDRFQPSAFKTAPSGRWHLKFEAGENELSEPAHVWNQRDDSLYGYPRRARQSYFEHPDYIRFDRQSREIRDDDHLEQAAHPDCPVKRQSLVNAIGTGRDTFTVGGYIGKNCEPARYSGGGPKINGTADDLRPDLLMTSEDSLVLPGIIAAGSRSGSFVWMNGTSVAAPQLARRIADLVATDTNVTRAKIKEEVEDNDPCPSKLPKEKRGGWGRLERANPQRRNRV